MSFAVIESAKEVCVRGEVEEPDRWPPRLPLVAVDQNPMSVAERFVDEIQRSIHDFLRDVSGIVGVYKIQDQTIAPIGDEIFRMILRCGSPPGSESLSVIWLPAGMDDFPAALEPDNLLIVVLAADKQFRVDFNHVLTPQSAVASRPIRSSR